MTEATATAIDLPSYREAFDQAKPTDTLVWEKHLTFGVYGQAVVLKEVKNSKWQRERVRMLGQSLEFKWNVLCAYLRSCGYNFHSRCVVTNYVYALKRGGVIK